MLQSIALFALLTIFDAGNTHWRVRAAPTVILDNATVTGVSWGPTKQFLGIPFAHPPTGNLRFQLPQALPPYDTSFSAITYGPACPQLPTPNLPPSNLIADAINSVDGLLLNVVVPSSEDCLTLNVITPVDATPESKLPVVVWILAGAFDFFSSSFFDGNPIVEKAVLLGVPAVYVSMNFRQNAFGFLASQEVKDAGVGNLGLQDQRLALRWIQKYIGAFGGDPTKVTIWGASSGSMAVALHMVTNGGNPEGLFRAAFMTSGSVIPVGDITNGQPYYDSLVADTGCSGVEDTLQCLREVPYDMLLAAISQSPGFTSYQTVPAWVPRVDGIFLTAQPLSLIQQGSVADVPFIAGNCDDEGTIFASWSINITTDAQFEQFLQMYLLPNIPTDTIAQLMKYYPADPTKGSPYDTGYLNTLTPQFKRIAAFLGDYLLQTERRFLVQQRSGKQNIWTYLNKRGKYVPLLGAAHGSDILDYFYDTDMTSYLVRFVTHLDPNVGESTDLYWPQYDATTNQTMLEYLDGPVIQALTTDTYRVEEMEYLTNVMFEVSW